MSNERSEHDSRLSRREVLCQGVLGSAGLLLAEAVPAAETVPATPIATPAPKAPKAKSVIQIWMSGGMSHVDTWDPKPDAGRDYMGDVKTIDTKVPGMRLSEWFPELAKVADKFSILNGMTHGDNGHETATYWMNTGRSQRTGVNYPGLGSVFSFFRSPTYKGILPPYIALTRSMGRFPEEGFLGSKYKPFVTGGDPSNARFEVEGVVARGISDDRQKSRRALIENVDVLGKMMPAQKDIAAHREATQQAYELIMGSGKDVFDLSKEEAKLRESYGVRRTGPATGKETPGSQLGNLATFGQCCLVARRLVEKGVPYVFIHYPAGMDTHSNHFTTMARERWILDQGLATLLSDLSARGLLDSTIVWCGTEFGRTPKIDWSPPWNGGRNHFGKKLSVLVAGGGFKGGHVVGTSDAVAETVKDRPVYPIDLVGSIYQLAGIDPAAKLPHPMGLDATVLPKPDEGFAKSGGLLKEIM